MQQGNQVTVERPHFRQCKYYTPANVICELQNYTPEADQYINQRAQEVASFVTKLNTNPKYGQPFFHRVNNYYYNEAIPSQWPWEKTPDDVKRCIFEGLESESKLVVLQKEQLIRIINSGISLQTVEERKEYAGMCDRELKKVQMIVVAFRGLDSSFDKMHFILQEILAIRIDVGNLHLIQPDEE